MGELGEPYLESSFEMAFFIISTCVVFLLLISGEVHSIARTKTKLGLVGDDDTPIQPFPTSWSSKTGSMYGRTDTKIIGSHTNSTLDANGFPCNSRDDPERGLVQGMGSTLGARALSSQQMGALQTPDYEFMPSKSKANNTGSSSEFHMAAAIKRALVNAPNSVSNILQAPVKMLPFLGVGVSAGVGVGTGSNSSPSASSSAGMNLGSGIGGTAVDKTDSFKYKASSSDSGSIEASAEDEDEGVFINVGAQNLGTTVAKVIDSSEVVKRGKLYTLGARKLHEKSPKVKEREMTMTNYYLHYYDSFNMKREFVLRKCHIEKMSAHATSGDVAGSLFYALRLEQGPDQLTIGSQVEEIRDEWYGAISEVVETIRIEEIENDGEEEEFRHKGLPSFAEQSFLNPQLPDGVRDKLETISNVRKRLTPFNAQLSSNSAPLGRGSSSIHAKLNDDHILSPLHGE